MSDTERLDTPIGDKSTVVNPAADRRHFAERDIDELKKAICRTQARIAAVSFGVLVLVGAVVWVILYMQVVDVRLNLTSETERRVATGRQVEVLEGAVVRREEIVGLAEKVKDLQMGALAQGGAIESIKQQQNRIDASMGMLSATVTALSTKVTEEQHSRDRLIVEMKKLGSQLSERAP